jgi:chorismate--pyruvate lyase
MKKPNMPTPNFIPINAQNAYWENTQAINTVIDTWLYDTQSLTQKLKNKFQDFSVQVLSQTQQIPHNNELEILPKTSAFSVREVLLTNASTPLVFARSIIPIMPQTKSLLAIGNQPLGEILFNHPEIKRGKLQTTCIKGIWGRRSIFILDECPILISEFFLETLYAR